MRALAITLLLLAASSEAQVIPVDLVIVRHKLATVAKQRTIAEIGLRRMKELGVPHPIVSVTVTKDFLRLNHTSHYVGRLDAWGLKAYRARWCRPGRRCHLLLPPIVDDQGNDFGGGVAAGACTVLDSADVSFAIAREKNGAGMPRVGASAGSVTHENLHNCGAEHDSGFNVMHPDAGKLGNVVLPITEDTKLLVDLCLYEAGLREVSRFGFTHGRN